MWKTISIWRHSNRDQKHKLSQECLAQLFRWLSLKKVQDLWRSRLTTRKVLAIVSVMMVTLLREIINKIAVSNSVPIFKQGRKQHALSSSRTNCSPTNKWLKRPPVITDGEWAQRETRKPCEATKMLSKCFQISIKCFQLKKLRVRPLELKILITTQQKSTQEGWCDQIS